MPHVRIDGPVCARAFWEAFRPGARREGDWIAKTTDAFLARDGSSVLLACTVVEGFLRQSFLVQILDRERGVLVRLQPGSEPEKTDGVRSCLAWIAHTLIEGQPAGRWANDTLGPAGPTSP